MPTRRPEVPQPVIARLRLTCLDLPEVEEESAWVGTRWTIRKKNFAHVLMIRDGWPPAYARAASTDGPACILTFRAPTPALDAPRYQQAPYFRPVWWPDIAGVVINSDTDWDEAAALVTRSYCRLAPKKLAALIGNI